MEEITGVFKDLIECGFAKDDKEAEFILAICGKYWARRHIYMLREVGASTKIINAIKEE